MSTPEARVKLTPEGVKEVQDALRRVERDAGRTSDRAARGINRLTRELGGLKRLLPAIGLAAGVTALTGFARGAFRTADEMGRLAAITGTTAESLSVFRSVADRNGASIEDVRVGLVTLSQRLDNLRRGVPATAQAFARLGLAQQDFAGADSVQAIARVASELSKVGDISRRTAIAKQVLGESGARLLPTLLELADKGFAGAREEAEALGLVIGTELAQAASAANHSLLMLQQQARGLSLQFAAGLAPSIAYSMNSVRDELEGKGVSSMRRWGESTGRTLRAVLGMWNVFVASVGGALRTLGEYLGGSAAVWGHVFRGEFRQAAEVWRMTMADAGRNVVGTFRDTWRELGRLIEDVKANPPEIEVRPVLPPSIDFGDMQATAPKDDSAAARRAELRELEAQRRAAEAGSRARFEIEQKILELSGQESEARLRALDAELAAKREILAAAGMLNAETEAGLARLRELAEGGIRFEAHTAEAERALDDLARIRQRIQQDVDLGILTEQGGRQRILEVERERLPVLQRAAEEAERMARALGSPELIAQAERLSTAVRDVEASIATAGEGMERFRDQAQDAITDDLSQWLRQGIRDADSLGDAFRALAANIADSLASIAANALATRIVTGAFGGFSGGGPVRAATGGLIRGPGTGTSDSIPALLSDGEFVTRAKVAKKPGGLQVLHALNREQWNPAEILEAMRATPRVRRFADGGLVTNMAGQLAGAPATSAKLEGEITLDVSSDLVVRTLREPAAERALLRFLQANRRAARLALGN